MADKKVYTNIFDINKDVEAYVIVRNGGSINLSHMRAVAQNRWPWFVQNWSELYKTLKTYSNGDQNLTASLTDLSREVTSYKLGNTNTNPFASTESFAKYSEFLGLIDLSGLNLTPDETTLRDKELERILTLDTEEFKQALDFIRKYTALYAGQIGLGDADAAKLLQLTLPTKQRTAKTEDLDTIQKINQLYKVIEGIVYDLQLTKKRPPNLLKIANSNIDASSDVVINESYISYRPIPFEISLEHMAKKYLGSTSRWFELATVNNLKPPFVDEVGSKLPLLAPPATNNLIISSSLSDKVFVGTKIGVGSYKYKEEARIVEKIILNENDTMVLFLSGSQDINKFNPSEGGFVRIYSPGTTRRGNYVLIPLTTQAATNRSAPTPTSDSLRRLEQVFINFGIDIARDSQTNDIIIDSNGNFKYAAGFPAVRQAVLFALKTTQGELAFHPDYGVNVNIGDRFYGSLNEAVLFGESLRSTLMKDPRFQNILIDKVSTTGTGISLGMLVYLEGSDQPIPLSFVS